MPSLAEHVVLGLTLGQLAGVFDDNEKALSTALLIAGLKILPDSDVVISWLMGYRLWIWHRTFTHSLIGAFVLGLLIWLFLRRIKIIPNISWRLFCLLIFMHAFEDNLFSYWAISIYGDESYSLPRLLLTVVEWLENIFSPYENILIPIYCGAMMLMDIWFKQGQNCQIRGNKMIFCHSEA